MTPCPRVDESHDHKPYWSKGSFDEWCGGSVTISDKSEPSSSKFLNDREVNLVLEVGANVGQFGTALRADGYSGTILSFESGGQGS